MDTDVVDADTDDSAVVMGETGDTGESDTEPPQPEILIPYPPPVLASALEAMCGLSPGGELSCWGEVGSQVGHEPYDPWFTVGPMPEGQWTLLMMAGAGLVLSPAAGTYAVWPSGPDINASPYVSYIFPIAARVVQVADFWYGGTCVLDDTGHITCSYDVPQPHPEGDGWIALDVSHGHLCAVHEIEGLQCWGDARAWGTLPEDEPHPRVVVVTSGNTCVITEDYRVACDGRGPAVLQVPALTDIVRLSVSWNEACAVDVHGAATCWGPGAIDHPMPPEVLSMNVHDVHVSYGAFCATDAQGTLICWGDDAYGRVSEAPERLR